MKIGIIGCGYVADYYLQTVKDYPNIEIKSVYDINKERLNNFCDYYSLDSVSNIDDILSDNEIELVINLTNPDQHFQINLDCLQSGKHVYSEKPIAMKFKDAQKLFEVAKEKKLQLRPAPCSYLSNTAETIKQIIDSKQIGEIRLVYACYDVAMTHKQNYLGWVSPSGAKWPAKDEFETGCTYEHAGYFLTWLSYFFGNANSVSAFSSCLIKDKQIALDFNAPDFTVGCIEYDNGVVARVTSSIVAPTDRSLTIVGEEGTIYTKDIRNDNSPVYINKPRSSKFTNSIEPKIDYYTEKIESIFNWLPWSWGNIFRIHHKAPLKRKNKIKKSSKYKQVDFCLGLDEMIKNINEDINEEFSSEMALQVAEITEILQYPNKAMQSNKLNSIIKKIP